MALTSTQQQVKQFVTRLVENINSRFPPEAVTIATAFSVMFPRFIIENYSTASSGLPEILSLAKHYVSIVGDVPYGDAINEYNAYKLHVKCNLSSYASDEVKANRVVEYFCQSSTLSSDFPLMVKLLPISSTIAPGSVDCERGFSTQNWLKDDLRSRMLTMSVSDQMRLVNEGKDDSEFDWNAATKTFLKSKSK